MKNPFPSNENSDARPISPSCGASTLKSGIESNVHHLSDSRSNVVATTSTSALESPRPMNGSLNSSRKWIGDSNSNHQPNTTSKGDKPSFSTRDFSYGKLLGLGSFSKVVKATLKSTNEVFALKIMDKRHIIRERKVQYVKREKNILSNLKHPGVVKLCFTFQDELSLYLGLECCEGGELFRQINLKGRLSFEEAQHYAAEIVDILEYIHGEGVIHRDLKPENLLLDSEGHLKLTDFGSAKVLGATTKNLCEDQSDDRNSSFVGTAEYVSPEVLNGSSVNYGVDMWALGCIIYQMLEGTPPFRARSEYLCFQKVLNRDFSIPSHFSSSSSDIINRLLEVDPELRLGSNPKDFDVIKSHPFFKGVDWPNLRNTVPPPMAHVAPPSHILKDVPVCNETTDEEWELAHLDGQFNSALSYNSLYASMHPIVSNFSSTSSSSSSSFSSLSHDDNDG